MQPQRMEPTQRVRQWRDFGVLLRRFRIAANLTQEDLAERANVSVHTISNLERGIAHRPRPDTMRLLAHALGLTDGQNATFLGALPTSALEPATEILSSESAMRFYTPALPTPLIGRATDILTACDILSRDEVRLLTLVGPPGVGKTSLALAIAAAETDHYADGCVWVPLAALGDPGRLHDTIAQALHLREEGTASAVVRLKTWLRARHLMLLLDNFEHLINATPAIADLLAACPALTVLVTSRSTLRIRGEHLYTVTPLAIPTHETAQSSLETLAQVDSVSLFCQQARTVRPDLTLTRDNASTITAICQRLDGLPLALELAASRLSLLSLQDLSARLEHALTLLTDGPSDLPPHQQTLRTTLAWSYNLLDTKTRGILRRLAVFAGGCTLNAAEMVCATQDDGEPESVLNGVNHLVNQHLLQREELAQEQDRSYGTVRINMLETIREYAREQLVTSCEEETARLAHVQYYLAFVTEAGQRLLGPEQSQWLDRVDREINNLSAAFRWAVEHMDAHLGLRLTTPLWQYWMARGRYSEGRAWLERMLTLAPADEQALMDLRASAHNGAGALAALMSDYDSAVIHHERALALGRTAGNRAEVASSLNILGGIALEQGDYMRARALWEECLSLRQEIGEMRPIASSLMNLAVLMHYQGDYVTALTMLQECLPLFRSLGNSTMLARTLNSLGSSLVQRGELVQASAVIEESLLIARAQNHQRDIALAVYNLAEIARLRGDYQEATAQSEHARAIQEQLGDQWHLAEALALLGTLARETGELAQAEQLLGESLSMRESIRFAQGCADTLTELGHLAYDRGTQAQAANYYQDALRRYREIASTANVPACLEGCTRVMRHADNLSLAVQLLGASAALRVTGSIVRPPHEQAFHERQLERSRTALGEERFTECWNTGEQLSMVEAIDLALHGMAVHAAD